MTTDLDRRIAESFESCPTWRAGDPITDVDDNRMRGTMACVSPLGHWKWKSSHKWRVIDGVPLLDSQGRAVKDDTSSWQPVSRLEPIMTVKMYIWLINEFDAAQAACLVAETQVAIDNGTADVWPEAVADAYSRVKGLK